MLIAHLKKIHKQICFLISLQSLKNVMIVPSLTSYGLRRWKPYSPHIQSKAWQIRKYVRSFSCPIPKCFRIFLPMGLGFSVDKRWILRTHGSIFLWDNVTNIFKGQFFSYFLKKFFPFCDGFLLSFCFLFYTVLSFLK